MKEMPLLTESMAPVVASFNQASSSVRSCARIRDSDEAEAPLNKRLCSLRARVSTGIQSSERKTEFQSSTSSPMCEDVECDESFGPGTPTKGEGVSESSRKISAGGWESLELCLLERVTRSLSVKDLSRLSQVNKHYKDVCARDALWSWRAAEKGVVKADEQESWRWNLKAACTGLLRVTPLNSMTDVHFSGDIAIVDPFRLFFAGEFNKCRQAELRRVLKESKHSDLVLTYRGIQSAVLRTSCVINDDDSAFEVYRVGEDVGANVTSSGVIAVVPKKLVLELIDENGGKPEDIDQYGVTVVGVNGSLRSSLDGDFIIRHAEPARGKPVEVPFSGEMVYADVICSTGGSWTEECESDDEEEELTEEEMAEAIAEVASLTNSYTSSPRLVSYCNGDGLIHKFTNFEVSMLS